MATQSAFYAAAVTAMLSVSNGANNTASENVNREFCLGL
jgi:hypothetical protein